MLFLGAAAWKRWPLGRLRTITAVPQKAMPLIRFGLCNSKKGEGLPRVKNTEAHVCYFITKGSFKILSEGETKTVGERTWVGFPPQTEYEVHCMENGSEILWVYVPPKSG